MRKSYKFKRKVTPTKKFYANERIRSPRVSVIDEKGEPLGEMETFRALAMAQERGLDLVEVAPNANPPVVKFLNYGSFQYQREKLWRKQKKQSQNVETKSLRISLQIGDHDKAVRVKQAEKFLGKGHNVKIEIMLKGREMQHQDLARAALKQFQSDMTIPHQVEQDVTKQGNKFFLVINPVK